MALKLPDSITQGDSLEWMAEVTDYKAAAGWDLTYSFRGNSQTDVTGQDDGAGNWSFVLTTSASAGLLPGLYSYVVAATAPARRQTIYMATLSVTPDITQLRKFDGSSHAQRMLTAIEKLMEGKAEDDIHTMAHNGKALTRYAPEELIKLHNHYMRLVRVERARERQRLGLASGHTKITRFRG